MAFHVDTFNSKYSKQTRNFFLFSVCIICLECLLFISFLLYFFITFFCVFLIQHFFLVSNQKQKIIIEWSDEIMRIQPTEWTCENISLCDVLIFFFSFSLSFVLLYFFGLFLCTITFISFSCSFPVQVAAYNHNDCRQWLRKTSDYRDSKWKSRNDEIVTNHRMKKGTKQY